MIWGLRLGLLDSCTSIWGFSRSKRSASSEVSFLMVLPRRPMTNPGRSATRLMRMPMGVRLICAPP